METKAKKEAASEKPQESAESKAITTYKGFGADWKCRDFQYEIGKSYETDAAKACEIGFHACENPIDVLRYYSANNASKFAVVEQSGVLSRHEDDSKVASTHITIKAEISLTELIKASIKYTMDRCTPAKGASSKKANTSVSAQGKNESATASGYSGAATASGRFGKARGKDGCALFLVYRDGNRKVIHAKAAIVGVDGIKPDVFYSLDVSGNFVEVAG